MAFRDDLRIWATTLDIDVVTNTPQRLTLSDDLWDKGWLRDNPVAAQHINELFFIITGALKDETLVPANNLSDVTNAATARTNLDTYTKSLNLSDIPNAATARTNLGVNTLTEVLEAVYPVGSIYTVTGTAINPGTLLGIGTWTAFGEGRVLIGVGTGTVDANGDALTVTDGATAGEVNHTLTEAEMPSHTHPQNGSADTGANFGYQMDSNNTAANPSTNVITSATGGDAAHNNTQAYIGVFMYRRIS